MRRRTVADQVYDVLTALSHGQLLNWVYDRHSRQADWLLRPDNYRDPATRIEPGIVAELLRRRFIYTHASRGYSILYTITPAGQAELLTEAEG